MKILINQNSKTIPVRKSQRIDIFAILSFSIIYSGVLPTNPTIGDEIIAALYSFLFIETNIDVFLNE
jgi:hypothetical protein